MKTWEEMSDEEQGALLLAHHRGESIQNKATGVWLDAPKPMWGYGGVYRVKPKETTYTGECWVYHYTSGEPTFAHFNVAGKSTHGKYTATHVDGKPVKITWEADQ